MLLGLGRMKPGKTPGRVGEDYVFHGRSHEAIPTRPVSSESADDETTSVARSKSRHFGTRLFPNARSSSAPPGLHSSHAICAISIRHKAYVTGAQACSTRRPDHERLRLLRLRGCEVRLTVISPEARVPFRTENSLFLHPPFPVASYLYLCARVRARRTSVPSEPVS